MRPTRRELLAAGAALAALPALADEPKAAPKGGMGVVIHSFPQRLARDRKAGGPGRIDDPLTFIEHARTLGAAGVQVGLGERSDEETDRIVAALVAGWMYVEGIVRLPRNRLDVQRFRGEIQTASNCGATVVRSVMLDGRRYETFGSADDFERFKKQAVESLELAEKNLFNGVHLAVENHKDLRADELIAILKRIDSEYLGVCLDTGNSISLLEDPMEVVEALAPWAITTHFKDMAVAADPRGFQLAEVPLGEGMLDLPRMVKVLRSARPEIRFNLEMITRDPLDVHCLEPKYWASSADVPGRQLARALRLVRDHAARDPLPRLSDRDEAERLAIEDRNIRSCLAFARERLGL